MKVLVRFKGSPVWGDLYHGKYTMYKGDTQEMDKEHADKLIADFGIGVFEIISESRSVDEPTHDRIVREPKRKRGRNR